MKQRVLLLADAELSSTLKAWLRGEGFDVYDAREPEIASASSTGCDWLAAALFPSREEGNRALRSGHRPRPKLLQKLGMMLESVRRKAVRFTWKEKQQKDQPATLFRWSEFDSVILQDLWYTSGYTSLIALGCVLASDDYYLRGNFPGRKIVLVTDPGFFRKVSDTEPTSKSAVALSSMFDDNKQITFLQLVGDAGENELPLQQLKRTLQGRPDVRATVNLTSQEEKQLEAYRNYLRNSASGSLMKQLSRYISERADLILVDDDPKVIGKLSTCLSDADCPDWGELEKNRVLVLVVGSQEKPEAFRNFPELIKACERRLATSATSGRNALFVTDILFDRVEWAGDDQRRTGIELIEALRDETQEWRQRVGIVAFTSLSSPFVTTSAYQRGADAVVFKGADALAFGHPHIAPSDSGIDRLLLMLASLCFQKEFLKQKRRSDYRDAFWELQHLMRVLPHHAASPHVQEEWTDTCYILKASVNYQKSEIPPEFEELRNELMRKYDDAE